jgi:hypothetical protein
MFVYTTYYVVLGCHARMGSSDAIQSVLISQVGQIIGVHAWIHYRWDLLLRPMIPLRRLVGAAGTTTL